MFKVNNGIARRCSSCLILNIFDMLLQSCCFFFADFENVNARWNTLFIALI